MDSWYFDENLSQREILERAAKEFGIKASRQTLTSYFRHREQILNIPDGVRDLEPKEEEALENRVGAGMGWDDLQAKTLRFAGMAAYELSLAEPGTMRVKEIRSLMKMVNEHHRLVMEKRMREEKLALQTMGMLLKARKDESKKFTKEDFEQMVMEGTEILNRAKTKSAESRAELDKRRREREAEDAEQSQAEMADEQGKGDCENSKDI
jgi:hypothetical protein